MANGDNPPIGLILCGSKGEALAKYATSGMDNQLFISKYLVQLPDKKVLENFIIKEIGEQDRNAYVVKNFLKQHHSA